ncbi:DNA internalization-related competence protein ComEC/Rec2 [Shimwellia blattae]|uniref:Rec2-related protein n=1 Tax=Shimwellia blattae (strain ATCC 29907 / DSM 4481 / JCM 1650 / NBRC 105725 / CDC 9005-74) TaxID=630626 RepID=I2BAN8_SHIBC|nr:DNA internalization-related competence protein ComEC/Rec2 [Shimwellia blattae]AFJ47592.1 Rec2-related protein [Shimwellia blattae DSM 4481 = NBRC 105725]GAB79830.1 hypothetical protein YcaI [Shimwellia blattae DSM 4481 = NBRC 105725]VDY65090.1 ComEC family competence protein [Shimwellia blattae]VEC23546.1 ComEC family competence protein [Shimwellia blattae]
MLLSLRTCCCCVIAGVLPLCWIHNIPGLAVIAGGTGLACLLLCIPVRAVRYAGLALLISCWSGLAAQRVLWPTTALTTGVIQGEGTILRPSGTGRYLVTLHRYGDKRLFPGVNIVVRGLKTPHTLCPGQRWSLWLRLRPGHGLLNIPGFDSQRYAVAHHQVVNGRVLRAQPLSLRCGWRSRFTGYLAEQAGTLRHWPVIQALAFGERQALPADVRQRFRETGTAHLMAISGLHIAQSAGVFWGLVRLLQWLLPAARIGTGLPLLAGVAGAALYTWLSGANPPAQRALLALIIWGALRLGGRRWSAEMVWLCCIAGVLLVDPLTVLSDSFRLSAGACGALILWYRWMPPPRGGGKLRYLAGLAHLQLGITALLLPLQVVIFHGVSLSAFVANMVAVPLVSLLVVPLLLLGMLLSAVPGATRGLWWLADQVLHGVLGFLAALPPGWLEADQRAVGLSLLPLVLMVIWRLRLYRSSLSVLPVALLACTYAYWHPAPPGAHWAVHMLDVGNGLAMVVEKNRRALLYDTGNRWPGGDSARQTIIPWLRWRGLHPEGVIISHGHLDHAGGLGSIQQAWPALPVYSAMLTPGHRPCFMGERWQWQGLQLRVLWPPRSQPGAENNHSCVVHISDGVRSVLLTGDIERPAELAMLKSHRGSLRADLLQVPHHGSRTSSTPRLLRQVNPGVALASVARYNPWRFPAAAVVRRYRDLGIRWYDTGKSGQISVQMFGDQMKILSARMQISPRWYHQWFGVPGDSG